MQRLFFHVDFKPGRKSGDGPNVNPQPATEDKANLIGSDTGVSDFHMPVLDVDRIPVRVVPSSTPGNSHLYIDLPMHWSQYARLIEVMGKVGILEPGYVAACLAEQGTFVRKPGVPK